MTPDDLLMNLRDAAGDGIRGAGTGALASTELLAAKAGIQYQQLYIVLALMGTSSNIALTDTDGTAVGVQINTNSASISQALVYELRRIPANKGLKIVVTGAGATWSYYIGRALEARVTS